MYVTVSFYSIVSIIFSPPREEMAQNLKMQCAHNVRTPQIFLDIWSEKINIIPWKLEDGWTVEGLKD